ncbi:MAG: hypothetical protein BGO81_04130 [Devosia sp. 66-22]|nr:MAG: hypothetical protein BGO81_04130 [Devosia sp. 66-22]
MVAALTIAWIPSYARISIGVVVATVHQPHIESLWVLGATRARLVVFHLLPTATRFHSSVLLSMRASLRWPRMGRDVSTPCHISTSAHARSSCALPLGE